MSDEEIIPRLQARTLQLDDNATWRDLPEGWAWNLVGGNSLLVSPALLSQERG